MIFKGQEMTEKKIVSILNQQISRVRSKMKNVRTAGALIIKAEQGAHLILLLHTTSKTVKRELIIPKINPS